MSVGSEHKQFEVVAAMSELWRLLLVEDDDYLNQSIVNSLRKDGYIVHGVKSGAEAIRLVWSEEFDVVIGDLKTPGADGFEMLQWLRTFRPETRMIMVTASPSTADRTQALEAGVVSYLAKPLDLHQLKEELRRLLQQTGFSASLDSFDLLDVIQIITMSRKSIALLVNTGLEEHGILRFQGGELIWAEYGILRGEEAFFALAAHKNGTVIHQPWNEQMTPNVTQPLSRLIFQALQYRAKYAAMQQSTGEQEAIKQFSSSPAQVLDEDSPFITLAVAQDDGIDDVFQEYIENEEMISKSKDSNGSNGINGNYEGAEWWQRSEYAVRMPDLSKSNGSTQPHIETSSESSSPDGLPLPAAVNITPSTVRKTPVSQRGDLPSWLIEQPTNADLPMLRLSLDSNTAPVPTKSSPAEWQSTPPRARITEQFPRKQPTGPQKSLSKTTTSGKKQTNSPEWQPSEEETPSNGYLHGFTPSRKTSGALHPEAVAPSDSPTLTNMQKIASPILQRPTKRNYSSLVAALQTLGYSITGFIATAVVGLDGQPIAQVTIDDTDISRLCGHFSAVIQGIVGSLQEGGWGAYEDTVITSANSHILIRIVGSDKNVFHMLVTTRESEPLESIEVMANVEAAIAAALHS
jgi:DNA-binding response OmpR family regulator/predicted regulator of Ras-like GTPase activity (Roadblock/LC7/MglB family)